MNIQLKNIKTSNHLSEGTITLDAAAFTATIYIDGKKAGTVKNHGTGGPNFYDFSDAKLEEDFHSFCHSQPKISYRGLKLSCNADLIIGTLLQYEETARQMKQWLKTEVIFRLHGDTEGAWRTVKHQGNPQEAKKAIIDKYGKKIETIIATKEDISVC